MSCSDGAEGPTTTILSWKKPRGTLAAVDGRERHLGQRPFRPVVVDPGGASGELARAHPMPVGDFGARHRERLQPADREVDTSQDAARIGGQQRVGRAATPLRSAARCLRRCRGTWCSHVRFGFGRGHHGAPFGVVRALRAARSRRCAPGSTGPAAAGSRVAERGRRWPR